MVSGCHCGVNEIFACVGCYTVLMGSYWHLVQHISPIFMGQADETDRLSWNSGNQLCCV